MINISKRLQLVASFIPDNSYIIDVGCDHALLDIYLATTLNNIKILATDINQNPLKSAKTNIKKYNLENKIKIEQKNGINNLDKEVDTVVIAGMGGILISNILKNKNNLKNIKNIIVSPNNEFPCVRKTLIKNGYFIEKEELLIEKNKTYLVIKAIKGKNKKIDYFFGILNNKDLNTIYYFTKLLNKNTNIIEKLPKKYIIKKIKLKIENKKINKFLKK